MLKLRKLDLDYNTLIDILEGKQRALILDRLVHKGDILYVNIPGIGSSHLLVTGVLGSTEVVGLKHDYYLVSIMLIEDYE